MAYHKVAEAHEALRQWPKASHSYAQAYEVVRHGLGPHHHLTKAFEKSSRCPQHFPKATTPTAALRGGKAPMFQIGAAPRLPSIPRSRHATPRRQPLSYDIGADVLEPWPPKNASKEEQEWYAMGLKKTAKKKDLPRK